MVSVSRRWHSARCSFRVCFLAFLWVSCLVVGCFIASGDSFIVSLMRLAPGSEVSIVGLAVVLILPLLISVVGLYYQKPVVVYAFSSLKAFCSGYLLYAVSVAFGSASWLMRMLLLFSDIGITIIVLWLVFRHLNGRGRTFKADIALSFFAAIMIGIMDYLLVTPFLQSLMDVI